jgi:hypothetical protein
VPSDDDPDLELTDASSELDRAAMFWADSGIDPVEIAFPKDTGLTLRHYRMVEDADGEEVEEAVFLAHKGKVHLFRSPEGLVTFLRSDAPHDLTAVDGWAEIVEKVTADDIIADEEDTYELDLVVENLRGGHDVWDEDLLIGAGELSRDLAFALRLGDVLEALAPGSPLDELDEAVRAEGFLARRRMRKVSAEQAAIGWRTVIGKLTAATEWHD